MFKKIKFDIRYPNGIATHEGKNVSVEEVIQILRDNNVIKFTAIRMSTKEALKSTKPIKFS